jgi:hypothetical protein
MPAAFLRFPACDIQAALRVVNRLIAGMRRLVGDGRGSRQTITGSLDGGIDCRSISPGGWRLSSVGSRTGVGSVALITVFVIQLQRQEHPPKQDRARDENQ